MSLRDQFQTIKPLELAGFSEIPPHYRGLSFRFLDGAGVQAQFDRFAGRVVEAIGHRYLPVYRMADGEFAFLLGWRRPAGESSLPRRLRGRLSRLYANTLRRRFSTMWGEEYRETERREALQRLEAALRAIAAGGMLAIYFAVRGDRWGEEYFEPMCDWLDAHAISLTADHYVPFYFVYALLNGPRRAELFRRRRVLVVTHFTEARKKAIVEGLYAEGAAAVHFLPISASRAMFDSIDVTALRGEADLALVGGGIGSANILTQLAPLSIPCIDAGISLECWIDPARRLERPFLIDDARRASLGNR